LSRPLRFEVIHPFVEGNGRSGRLLVTWLLCTWNLIPEPLLTLNAYLEAQRQDYYDGTLAVTFATAQRHINCLEAAGLLPEIKRPTRLTAVLDFKASL
jgi:fido (protein-threonine AMPylation protein)